jgi:mechanosensitive ion channel protein 4/5/6/7/8/9/10
MENLMCFCCAAQGTLAVASAYAIGGSVSLMFQALMFIVLYSPYEVGDRVVIEGVQSDSSMIVTDITVTTTTFELGSGKKVIMANQVLMSKNIVNFRRSTSVSVTVKFGVGYRTTREQLSQLQERLKAYVKRHSVDWKKSVSISVSCRENEVVRVSCRLRIARCCGASTTD